MVEHTSDLIAKLIAKAEAEVDPVDALLFEVRRLSKNLEEDVKKRNGGNGGGGWLSRLLTDKVIAFLIGGMIALTVWVGITNVRLALAERALQNLPPVYLIEKVNDHEGRIRTLENRR